ncbi:multidrug transporter [Pseudozyma hubeiensis SY62]|uniref:Multidrug transporter n=1 Tax=Pseudozyma hubeiensis (strain SY62) TaxID=1305764 RepID=R9P2Q3_PSEHS|nr:multidrug transporter [Pseudozyma hubeiensis SY62]GAC95693.1 multidrug transporter [Pseudozyma hubeiensis SY62]
MHAVVTPSHAVSSTNTFSLVASTAQTNAGKHEKVPVNRFSTAERLFGCDSPTLELSELIDLTMTASPATKPASTPDSIAAVPSRDRNRGSSPPEMNDPPSEDEAEPYCAFTSRYRHFVVATVSMVGFFSPLTINIYIPALPQIASALHVSEGESRQNA